MNEEENKTISFPFSLFRLQSCLLILVISFPYDFPHQTVNSCSHNKCFKCNLPCLHIQSGLFSSHDSCTVFSFFSSFSFLTHSGPQHCKFLWAVWFSISSLHLAPAYSTQNLRERNTGKQNKNKLPKISSSPMAHKGLGRRFC